jgi:hypothetical protein
MGSVSVSNTSNAPLVPGAAATLGSLTIKAAGQGADRPRVATTTSTTATPGRTARTAPAAVPVRTIKSLMSGILLGWDRFEDQEVAGRRVPRRRWTAM